MAKKKSNWDIIAFWVLFTLSIIMPLMLVVGFFTAFVIYTLFFDLILLIYFVAYLILFFKKKLTTHRAVILSLVSLHLVYVTYQLFKMI